MSGDLTPASPRLSSVFRSSVKNFKQINQYHDKTIISDRDFIPPNNFQLYPRQTIDEKFNGTYRLDKTEALDSVSRKWVATKWRGTYTDGFIQYDGKGHMSVHLYPRGYKDVDTNKNIDSVDRESLKELARFYQNNFVYFANYKIINDSTIEHHRVSATEPQNFGSVLTRRFEFRKDTLLLTPIEKIESRKGRLRWIKL